MSKKIALFYKKGFYKEKVILKIFTLIALFLIIINFSIISISSQTQTPKLKVSILYFNNRIPSSEWDWLSKGLTDMLIDDISRFNVVACSSRQEIENVFLKYNLSSSQTEIDKSKLIKFNEDLNSVKIFFGSYFLSSSSELSLSLKEYNVKTGDIITFRDLKVGNNDFFTLKE